MGEKFRQMRDDLNSLVTRLNKDRSYDAAMKAQIALTAVGDLEDSMPIDGDCDWDWQPEE